MTQLQMATSCSPPPQWLDTLATRGYVVMPDFLPPGEAQALYQYALHLPEQQWQLAGIGRQQQHTVNTRVRNDHIHWLNAVEPAEQLWLQQMEQTRQLINRELFMGLFDYESHLARYQPGARYKKHLDAFKGRSNRVLTTVFYLNPVWQPTDGGELVIYGDSGEVLETVLPHQGTLVVFLSERFVHEVRTAHRQRYSLTGWFRHNTTNAAVLDPAN